MKITFGKGGRTHRFYLPLSRFAIRLILKAAISSDKEKRTGQGSDERVSGEEIAGAADAALKALKKFRRSYGHFTLLEVYDEKEGKNITVTI